MKVPSSILLILYILLFQGSTLQCPQSSQNQKQITSDRILLTNQPNSPITSRKQYSIMLKKTFKNLPNVAIGINKILSEQQSFADLKINFTTQLTSIKFIITTISSIWNVLEINFLASNRQDLDIGNIFTTIPQNKSSSFMINYPLKKYFRNYDHIAVKNFVHTFSIRSKNLQNIGVNFFQWNLRNRTLQLFYGSPNNDSQIYYLGVSIILFDKNTQNFLFWQGRVEQSSYPTKQILQLNQRSVRAVTDYIIGIRQFSYQSANPLNLNALVQNPAVIQIFNSQNSFTSDYLALDSLAIATSKCGFCTGHPFLYQNNCVSRCPNYTMLVKGQCISQAKCLQSQLPGLNGTCIDKCQPGLFYDMNDKKCKARCQTDKQKIGQRCFCKFGEWNETSSSCRSCQNDQMYVNLTKKCQKKCPIDFRYDQRNRICYVPCGYNEQYRDKKCQCLYGLRNQIGECNPCYNQKKYFNVSTRNCVICGENQTFKDGKCICKQKYAIDKDGKCVEVGPCKPGYVYDATTGLCRKICPYPQRYSAFNRQCICVQGVRNNNGTCEDPCSSGYQYDYISKLCKNLCRDYEIYNMTTKKCQCVEGYQFDLQGVCKPNVINCGLNKLWNPNTKLCQCCDGYFEINGQCVYQNNCPRFYIWNNVTCVCWTTVSTGNDTFKPPSNPNNSIADGNCTDCGNRSFWTGLKCQVCDGQLYWDADQDCCKFRCNKTQMWDEKTKSCVKRPDCGQNFYWNGIKCCCIVGTMDVNGNCVSDAFTYNRQTHHIVQKLWCKPGSFLINGKCMIR